MRADSERRLQILQRHLSLRNLERDAALCTRQCRAEVNGIDSKVTSAEEAIRLIADGATLTVIPN